MTDIEYVTTLTRNLAEYHVKEKPNKYKFVTDLNAQVGLLEEFLSNSDGICNFSRKMLRDISKSRENMKLLTKMTKGVTRPET